MRTVTNEDVQKYSKMVEYFIKRSVVKNWKEASQGYSQKYDISLGNSGMSLEDFKSYLFMEVVVALQKFNPNKGAKESSFIYLHLQNRIGQKMKQLTRKAQGYGVWQSNINEILHEIDSED